MQEGIELSAKGIRRSAARAMDSKSKSMWQEG